MDFGLPAHLPTPHRTLSLLLHKSLAMAMMAMTIACPSPCRAVLPHAAPLPCSLACMAALANTRIPHIELTMAEDGEEPELELDDDMSNSVALDLQRLPLIVSVSQVQG